MRSNWIRGLYAITPETRSTEELVTKLECAMRGGVKLVQYRNKQLPLLEKHAQCRVVRDCIRAYGGRLIVNDDPHLAADVEADGVHIGENDATIDAARLAMGLTATIGVSCYNRIDLARQAQAAGADYVAFGSFFPSTTKPDAARAGFELLGRACAELDVPIVAIGGIGKANVNGLIKAGASAVAMLSAIFDVDDIEIAAREITHVVNESMMHQAYRGPDSDVRQKQGSI